MAETKKENKKIIRATGKLINAKDEHYIIGRRSSPNRRNQHNLKLNIDTGSDKVNKVFIRFGQKVGGRPQYQWGTTMVIEPLKISPGKKKTVRIMDHAHIPENAEVCQVLYEIPDGHGHPEILMTDPTSLV
jgi:hypothetical protein